MTTQTEALKRALEALESSNKLINGTGTKFGLEGAMDGYYSGCFDVEGNNKLLNKSITSIKEALAQPEQEKERCVGCEAYIDTACGRDECPKGWPKAPQPEQEPVACVVPHGATMRLEWASVDAAHNAKIGPLYTTPPQRKPLTRGQIREIEVDVSLNPSFDYITPAEQLCRAIEAAHGIKG